MFDCGFEDSRVVETCDAIKIQLDDGVNWWQSDSIRVRVILYKPAPEHWGSVQRVIELKPIRRVRYHCY